jgi:serine/threonine protein kinase
VASTLPEPSPRIARFRAAPEAARWTIGDELGRGAFGAVYAAVDTADGTPRAVKVLLPQGHVAPDADRLLQREIDNLATLDHPNVLRQHASGRAAGLSFIVTELCAGGSVAERVAADGPFAADEAVRMALDVLAGLEYAHNGGLVHRDVKPANVLVGTDGGARRYKLGDFGLAKAFDLAGLSGFTGTGTAAGTPAFMPRQQVVNFKYAKPEVDVWAAAATLYFALTGHPPRTLPADRDPWLAVWTNAPTPVLDRGVPVPAALARVVDEALIDRPAIRFATAGALRSALISEFGEPGRD